MKRTAQNGGSPPPPSKRSKKNDSDEFVTYLTDGTEGDKFLRVDIDDVTQPGLPVSKIYVGRSEMSKGDGLVIGRSHFEDPKFGAFNPANFARLSRDHFSIHLYNVAGRLVPILKRRSGNPMVFENNIIEKDQPVEIEDGSIFYVLMHPSGDKSYLPDIRARFILLKKTGKDPMTPRSSKRQPVPIPAEQSQVFLEFWESTQTFKEALADPKKASFKETMEEDANDGFEPAPEEEAPSPKKKKKRLVQSAASKLQPMAPPEGSVKYVPRASSPSNGHHRAVEKPASPSLSVCENVENLMVCFLGFSDIADLPESRSNLREDAILAGKISSNLRKMKATTFAAQYTLLESQLSSVDLVCIHDQTFTLKEYNRFFLALRRNPRVEFVISSYLAKCATQGRLLDFESNELERSRLFGSELMYLLLDESGLEHIVEYKAQLDALGNNCSYFKLKTTLHKEAIANLPAPCKAMAESMMKKKQLLEYVDVYELFPSDLNPVLLKALTLLWNYRMRCRDVVIISDSELLKRQAALWQIEVVDRQSFAALLQRHSSFVEERIKVRDSPDFRWDSNGVVKK